MFNDALLPLRYDLHPGVYNVPNTSKNFPFPLYLPLILILKTLPNGIAPLPPPFYQIHFFHSCILHCPAVPLIYPTSPYLCQSEFT